MKGSFLCIIFGHKSLSFSLSNDLGQTYKGVYCSRCYSTPLLFNESIKFISKGEKKK